MAKDKDKPETALAVQEPEQVQMMQFGSEQELLDQGFTTELFHKVTEGDKIFGLFVGRGDDVELKEPDPKTGEVVTIPTWRIKGLSPNGQEVGVTMVIPGKYELNRFFRSQTPGNTLVGIKFLDRIQIGTRQVTRFVTMSKQDDKRKPTGESEVQVEKRLKAEAEATANATAR